jgi:predicted NACHT family NTPase
LEENRDGLRLHRQLTEAAQEWNETNRSEDLLFRGARLAQVREWAATHAIEMNVLEHEFLDASKAWADHDIAEREAQRQRELKAAQKLAESEHRSAKQLRRRAVYLAGALLITIFLAAAALFLRNQAETEKAISASRELAAAAISNLEDDPERSILLALQAESTYHTLESENALHRSLMDSRVRLVLHQDSPIWDIAYSPDGTRVATASQDKTAKVWDSSSGRLLLTLTGHTESVNDVAFSPDGKLIATSSHDRTVKIWDAQTGKESMTLTGHTDGINRLMFSPDGKRLVTASRDKTAKVWDVRSGEELVTFSAHEAQVWEVAFSPDGTRVASSGQDGNVRVWDAGSGKELLTLPVGNNAI